MIFYVLKCTCWFDFRIYIYFISWIYKSIKFHSLPLLTDRSKWRSPQRPAGVTVVLQPEHLCHLFPHQCHPLRRHPLHHLLQRHYPSRHSGHWHFGAAQRVRECDAKRHEGRWRRRSTTVRSASSRGVAWRRWAFGVPSRIHRWWRLPEEPRSSVRGSHG